MGVLFFIAEITVILVVLLCIYIKWKQSFWKRKGIPHLIPEFPWGNFGNLFHLDEQMSVSIKHAYLEMKSKEIKCGGVSLVAAPILIPVDLQVIRSILSKNFHSFTDRGVYHNEDVEPLDGHLFLIDGTKWRNLRVKLTPTFTSGKMKMMFNILVGCGEPLIQALDEYANNEKPIDIKELLECFTTDVIGSCAFGIDCNSFGGEETEFQKYSRRFFRTSVIRQILLNLAMFFPNIAKKLGFTATEDVVSQFFVGVVKDTVEYREKTKFERNDFIQLLINIKNTSGEGFTVEEIAAQAFVFFLAGFETSSTAMTFCLFELAQNHDIQDKLRQEINRVLGRHEGKFSYESIQEMKYLGQVLDEALRKYPPVSAIPRICTQDCFIEEAGFTIEKGWSILFPVLGLHHDPEYFPDPEKFDPERFSDENKESIPAYSYLPFGEGPRNCIGARFGLMQSKVGLALLIKNFEFTLNGKTIMPMKTAPRSIILAAQGGIWLNARRIR